MTWKEGDVIRRVGISTSRVTKGKYYVLHEACTYPLKIYDDHGQSMQPTLNADCWELEEKGEVDMTWKEGDVLTRVAHSAYFLVGKSYEVYKRKDGRLRVIDEDGEEVAITSEYWKLKEEGVKRVLWDESRNPCSEIELTKPINEIKKETIMSNVTNVKDLNEYVQRPVLVFGKDIAKCDDGQLLDLIAKCKGKVEALEDLCPESTKVQNSCIEMENVIIEMVELLDGGEE